MGWLDIVRYMIEKDKNLLEHKDQFKQTALIHAASKGHIEVVKYLVEQGADLTAATSSSWDEKFNGRTAFDWANLGGHNEVSQFLVKYEPIRMKRKDSYVVQDGSEKKQKYVLSPSSPLNTGGGSSGIMQNSQNLPGQIPKNNCLKK